MRHALRSGSMAFCPLQKIIRLVVVFTFLGSGVSACPNVDQNAADETIFDIVSCGDMTSLENYAKSGGDLDVQRNGHHTALWAAIVDGRLKMASRLIELGANVNAGEDAPFSALILFLPLLRGSFEDRELIALINEFVDAGANFDIRRATGSHLLIDAIAAICEIPALGTMKDLNRIATELHPNRVSLNETDRTALDHLRTLSALGLYDSNCVAGFAGGAINDG